MHGCAGVERALVRVQAFESRQQRRVNVDEAAVKMRDKRRRQDAHEAGQRDQIRRERFHPPPQRVEELRGVGVVGARHRLRGHPRAPRPRQADSRGAVADDRGHARR